jgi:hypothetical protein
MPASAITPSSSSTRPGRVRELRGIIFQSDEHSIVGSWFIRPIEMLDRRLAGLGRAPNAPSLAMHAGIDVILDDGREFVVEQLVGGPSEDFVDGLHWTPIEAFRSRDHGGWDVTIPATAFRRIDQEVVEETIEYLNNIPPKPFIKEDCTMLVERAFGKRRMFADSPTARTIGLGLRVGDPALPLLRPEIRLDKRAELLLHAETLRALPNPTSDWDAPNARLTTQRILWLLLIAGSLIGLAASRRKRR